jgi:hypothetical protein
VAIMRVAKSRKMVLSFLIVGDLVPFGELHRDNGPEICKRRLVAVDVEYNSVAILHVLCHPGGKYASSNICVSWP